MFARLAMGLAHHLPTTAFIVANRNSYFASCKDAVREKHHCFFLLGRYSGVVKHSVSSTTPTAEKPALSDEERAERRRRLIERALSPGGLDRETLERIEQLTGDES